MVIHDQMKSERQLLKYRGNECLNCFQPLDKSEKYCHYCGQLNSIKKLTFDDFFNEFFAGILAYDSRFYRTLNSLLLNPGKISKDYIEGKRQRDANPYRFYLSASIIFFVIWGFTNDLETVQEADAATRDETITEVDSILTEAEVPFTPSETVTFRGNQSLEEIYVPYTALDTMSFSNSSWKKLEIFSKYYNENEIADAGEALEELEYPPTSYNRWLYKKTVDLNLISSNPALCYNYFVNKLPFIIFFYLPLFALFIWLLYARRPYSYMEHLIFTFHNQTMWFVLFSIAILVEYLSDSGISVTIAIFIFLFYLYKAFRRFYRQSRVKTILKFIIINGIFLILAVVATIFSIFASFAVY